jgi:hypothetical protein
MHARSQYGNRLEQVRSALGHGTLTALAHSLVRGIRIHIRIGIHVHSHSCPFAFSFILAFLFTTSPQIHIRVTSAFAHRRAPLSRSCWSPQPPQTLISRRKTACRTSRRGLVDLSLSTLTWHLYSGGRVIEPGLVSILWGCSTQSKPSPEQATRASPTYQHTSAMDKNAIIMTKPSR